MVRRIWDFPLWNVVVMKPSSFIHELINYQPPVTRSWYNINPNFGKRHFSLSEVIPLHWLQVQNHYISQSEIFDHPIGHNGEPDGFVEALRTDTNGTWNRPIMTTPAALMKFHDETIPIATSSQYLMVRHGRGSSNLLNWKSAWTNG